MSDKKPLIILTGPTAVGKTSLSLKLARAVNGAVISADSMQVYKEMNIGSAKIMPDEMQGVDHYLIDVLSPMEPFNVVRFQAMAKEAALRIYEQGKIPIVTGGTGFYIQAFLYDIDFTKEDSDESLRHYYEKLAEEKGSPYLHEILREKDPVSADTIHPNNIKRIIRALEFYDKSNSPISAHNEEQRLRKSPYSFAYFVLNDDREKLYQKIDKRVDDMAAAGLLDEVKHLRELGCTKDMVSMQGLGYKEMLSYLDGEISYDEALRVIKRDTRHFAKRQLTWFRRERDVIWINKADYDNDEELILKEMLKYIKNI